MNDCKFKVGDKVRLRDPKDVPQIDRDTVVSDMNFKGFRTIVDAYQAKTANIYKVAGKGNYLYTEALLEKGEEGEQEIEDFKEVSLSQENITLSRDDFHDVAVDVMADFVANPPKDKLGRDTSKASFLLAMAVPVIADKIEEKLFGKKDKEDE